MQIRNKYSDRGNKEELVLLIKLTKRAEDLGFKVKDKLYLEDGSYYGKIFRYFTIKQINTFLDDSKKDQYADIFIKVNRTIDGGAIGGKIVDGKLIWDYWAERG